MQDPTSLPFVACALAAALATTSAGAASVDRRSYQNGGSACTGALPTYEGALRKRPQSIVNEGTTNAFVTCSTDTAAINAGKPTVAYVVLSNYGTGSPTATCTMVNGASWEGSEAFPESRFVPVGPTILVMWGSVAPDAPEFTRRTVSFSCSLPPGVGVDYVGRAWREDNGVPTPAGR